MTRPCTVFQWQTDEKGVWVRNENGSLVRAMMGKGVFHQWGSDYEEFETGPGNYSVAIVELSDGTLVTPTPNMVQFDDEIIP